MPFVVPQALHRDINAHVKQRKGYRPEEQIIDFRLVLAGESGGSQSLRVKVIL